MTAVESEFVLVVEDDEGVALLQRRALQRRGYRVQCASTLPDALAAARSQTPDLIVSDYRLENDTGLDLLAEVKAIGLDIPVILVTGFSDESTVIEAIRSGARDFVPKTAEYLRYLPDAVERVLRAVRTERELATSEARFQLFMENSPAIAFIKDHEGRLLYANRATAQVIGTPDWKGRTDFELWPADAAEQQREHDLAVLRANAPIELLESLPLPSGDIRHFLAYKFPMQDVRGQRFVGGMAVDITQQRRAEEALRQRDEQLRQAQKMEAVGTLAGGIAHEFNNLLQAVLGYTRFAISSIEEGHQAQTDLQIVVSAAERAALLTQQLLSFSRRETAELMPLDLNVAIHELVGMLRPLIGEMIQIDLALDETVGMISADHAQIQQLLMNLCINARDAMEEGGKITITTRGLEIDSAGSECAVPGPGRYIVVTVSDTGCGMTAEVKQKIFEPFFTTKAVGKGTGLGLAMVYGAVQHHAGMIEVESESGVGTRFTVYLPLNRSGAFSEASNESPMPRHGTETVLVAEDEPLVLNLATRILTGAGYRVIPATNGEDAVRLFEERRDEIDLLMFDAAMPRLGGWEAIRQIRQLEPSVPAIIATGYDGHQAPDYPLGSAPRLLRKPFALDDLLQAVHHVLEEARSCSQV